MVMMVTREFFTSMKCEEWWKNPRVDSSGEPIIDHNHICKLDLNHAGLCQCKCGALRPVEDYD